MAKGSIFSSAAGGSGDGSGEHGHERSKRGAFDAQLSDSSDEDRSSSDEGDHDRPASKRPRNDPGSSYHSAAAAAASPLGQPIPPLVMPRAPHPAHGSSSHLRPTIPGTTTLSPAFLSLTALLPLPHNPLRGNVQNFPHLPPMVPLHTRAPSADPVRAPASILNSSALSHLHTPPPESNPRGPRK